MNRPRQADTTRKRSLLDFQLEEMEIGTDDQGFVEEGDVYHVTDLPSLVRTPMGRSTNQEA